MGKLIHEALSEYIPGAAMGGLERVVSVLDKTHLAQMTGYLALTGLRLASLLNFKHAKLQWKRVMR